MFLWTAIETKMAESVWLKLTVQFKTETVQIFILLFCWYAWWVGNFFKIHEINEKKKKNK